MILKVVSILVLLLQSTQPAKTGSFEQAFTERSPQTEMKSIVKKLGIKNPDADYHVNEQTFMTFVPEKYTSDKPMGLVILVNYKNADTLPSPVLPQFEDAYCALLVGKDSAVPTWYRIGQSIDAVYNMKKLYAIDPKRVYIFNTNGDMCGEIAGVHYPDVFTGVVDGRLHAWHKVKWPNGGTQEGDLPPPDSKSLGIAKSHPFFDMWNEVGDAQPIYVKALKEGGFKYVELQKVTTDQWHYPMYTTDWLPAVFKFLDGATSKLKITPEKPPTTKPAHKPATNPSK